MAKVNSWMDEAWERVVEAALDGQATPSSELRVLNLDGAMKSLHGSLPPAGILERFPSLEHLSIANVGALSLEKFPRLRNLQRLILSDNRIAGGLENLVQAGLHSLRDLDLSNNRIQYIDDLAPLAKLHLVSLDLYECPVTRVDDYRSKVFSMIRTLKYLDKLDANENERPETDDEEEEEDEYDYDDFDPGSGEVDGDDRTVKQTNGRGDYADVDDVIVDADEDEESDADEEIETSRRGAVNGFSIGSSHQLSNGFRVAHADAASVDGNENDAEDDVEVEEEEEDEEDEEDDDDLGEEIDEEDGEDTDVVEVHDALDSDEEDEDGVDDVEVDEEDIDIEEEEEDDDVDDDLEDDDEVDLDEEEVGVEDEEDAEPGSSGRLARFEDEIDGHEHGEEDENGGIGLNDENGEIGEEDELGVEERDVEEDFIDGEDEDDLDGDYLVQPIARPNSQSRPSNFNAGMDEDDDVDQEDHKQNVASSNKRRRDDEGDLDDDDEDAADELSLSKRH